VIVLDVHRNKTLSVVKVEHHNMVLCLNKKYSQQKLNKPLEANISAFSSPYVNVAMSRDQTDAACWAEYRPEG